MLVKNISENVARLLVAVLIIILFFLILFSNIEMRAVLAVIIGLLITIGLLYIYSGKLKL